MKRPVVWILVGLVVVIVAYFLLGGTIGMPFI